MPDSSVQLTQMTLATSRTPEMVKFYDILFGTNLQAMEAYGTTLYHGTLAGIPLVICPNEVAGVEAEQSRHQLAFQVDDLPALLQNVENAGGAIQTPVSDSSTRAILKDPDGNTIEVIQS